MLSWDEMKIKEDLVFDKHTCTLVGFTNVGEVNDVLDKVEQQALIKSPTVTSALICYYSW